MSADEIYSKIEELRKLHKLVLVKYAKSPESMKIKIGEAISRKIHWLVYEEWYKDKSEIIDTDGTCYHIKRVDIKSGFLYVSDSFGFEPDREFPLYYYSLFLREYAELSKNKGTIPIQTGDKI